LDSSTEGERCAGITVLRDVKANLKGSW